MPEVFLGADLAGRDVVSAVKTAYARYSFASDGGAVTAITPLISDQIPIGAMIGGYVKVIEAPTSLGSATIAIGTTAGSAANSLLTATAKASFPLGSKTVLVPTTPVPVAMAAAGRINITVATAALTAGILDIYVYYI